MHIQTVRSIAKQHGIKTSKLTKVAIIHSIQRSEGNFDCFGTAASGECDQLGCSWRDDCLPKLKKAKA